MKAAYIEFHRHSNKQFIAAYPVTGSLPIDVSSSIYGLRYDAYKTGIDKEVLFDVSLKYRDIEENNN